MSLHLLQYVLLDHCKRGTCQDKKRRDIFKIYFVLDWMAMAEGQEGLSETIEVADASRDGALEPQSPVVEKPHDRQNENKKTQPKETRRDKAHRNGESNEITLPVGCKVTPKNEQNIVLHTNNIMEALKATYLHALPYDYSIEQLYQVYQNVSVHDLKDILENTCILLREGHQNSTELLASISTLCCSCTTSAAVKRVLSFPGIVPLFKDFIDTYMIAFISTPFLKSDQLAPLARSLTLMLCIIGKLMAFSKPSQSGDLLTWWKAIDELYQNRCRSAFSNFTIHRAINNDCDGLEFLSGCLIVVSKSMEQMQATHPPQPWEIVKRLNPLQYYAVFCSSLQCPVFAEEDGVLLHCARCKLAAYCSRQCQRQHWKQGHKEKCWKMTWNLNLRLKLGEVRQWAWSSLV